MPHPISGSEYARLSTLYRYGVIDTPHEPEFNVLVARLAADLDVPMVQLVFADAHRLIGKAAIGLKAREYLRAGSLPDRLIEDQASLDIPDLLDVRENRLGILDGVTDLRAFLGVRLETEAGEAIGALFAADRRRRTFTPDDQRALEDGRNAIMALLENRRRQRLDPATGALSRGPFLEQIGAIIGASRTGGQPVSLVLLDTTGFRARLDAVGSGLGRLVLQRVGDLGREQVRHRDSFGRLDEARFAVLLTDTDHAGAKVLEQRLMTALGQGWDALAPVLNLNPVTIGIATWRPGDVEEPYALLQAAAIACTNPPGAGRPSLVA